MASDEHYGGRMNFTPLHRALGLPPGPLTDEILNSAVDAKVSETDDLDWKAELPPIKGLSQTDVPKDIAAMANSGGGTIVYGVMEHQKVATERSDAGDFTEGHERAYRSVAVTAISPPVFGLEVQRLGTGPRAVAVTIPASVDGPHLIYRNDFFGAPIRNDADTAWMKERQIEAMYRARFDERRRANEALATLFAEAIENHNTSRQAWLVAVAHPRVPGGLTRLSRDVAREIFRSACSTTLRFSKRNGVHPLENVDSANPRPGLRRWIAPTTATGDSSTWKEAWASVHHDGSVTLSATIGGASKEYGRILRGLGSRKPRNRMRCGRLHGARSRRSPDHAPRGNRRADWDRVERGTATENPDSRWLWFHLRRVFYSSADIRIRALYNNADSLGYRLPPADARASRGLR